MAMHADKHTLKQSNVQNALPHGVSLIKQVV